MEELDREGSNQETYRRLKWTLFLRLLVVTFLLIATIIVHLSRSPSLLVRPLLALYLLSGLSYFITLVSLLITTRVKRLWLLIYSQIAWEVIFVTSLIYITGGIESIFSFLYLLAVITAALLDFRRGAFLAATANSAAGTGILLLLYLDVIPPLLATESKPDLAELVSSILWNNFIAIFAIAILSSYLAEKIRVTTHELEETKDDLIQLSALNESIVHSIGSGLITLTPGNRITFMNPAAERILGLKADQFLGKPFSALLPQIDILEAEKADRSFKVAYETPEGDKLLIDISINALHDSKDREVGKLIIFTDITQIRAMEEQLRIADRLAAVGKLAAGMAHEIRNPLAAISGSVQMLEKDPTTDQTSRDLMQIMRREADRLNNLINEFLTYARPVPRIMKEVDVNHVIQEVLQVSRNREDLPRDMDWYIELEDGIQINSDPQLIKQIFWNLLNNAIEATRHGGLIKVSTRLLMAGDGLGDRLEFCIEDEGVGIEKENLDKIFDPFFTTRERGSGLGLSIVWRIVEAMRGEVKVESEPGKGSRFTVRIPCSFPDRNSERSIAAAQGSG